MHNQCNLISLIQSCLLSSLFFLLTSYEFYNCLYELITIGKFLWKFEKLFFNNYCCLDHSGSPILTEIRLGAIIFKSLTLIESQALSSKRGHRCEGFQYLSRQLRVNPFRGLPNSLKCVFNYSQSFSCPFLLLLNLFE